MLRLQDKYKNRLNVKTDNPYIIKIVGNINKSIKAISDYEYRHNLCIESAQRVVNNYTKSSSIDLNSFLMMRNDIEKYSSLIEEGKKYIDSQLSKISKHI